MRLLSLLLMVSVAAEAQSYPSTLVHTSIHKQAYVAVTVDAASTEEVCVNWRQPFSQCAATGNNPMAPCQTGAECGTSLPCTFLAYSLQADVQDEIEDMRGLRVNNVTYLNPSRACVVVWNQDPDSAHDGVVTFDGYTGGME